MPAERRGFRRLLLGARAENEMGRAVAIVCVGAFALSMLRLLVIAITR